MSQGKRHDAFDRDDSQSFLFFLDVWTLETFKRLECSDV